MAGETIGSKGAYTNILTAATVANAAFSLESTSIATALSVGAESDYPLLDFKLTHSATTPTTGDLFHLYVRVSDGTDKAPAPVADFKQTYVGTFVMDNAATGDYYLSGIPNDSPESTYYLEGALTATLTVALAVRGRTYKAAS
jgi:hypothetical protein